jgi:TonB-dependent starch-binding outer membrane protein SusC
MAKIPLIAGSYKRLPIIFVCRYGILFIFAILTTLTSFAQPKIKGKVLDETSKLPVIGATVKQNGQSGIAVSNVDGDFSVNVKSFPVNLQVSSIGYKSQEIVVNDVESITIYLAEDLNKLSEIVVVGYGTQKRSDLTGALTLVTEKQIKERPVQNAVQALQGKAAGVDITSNVRPGEIGIVRVRGNRSINASNDPLYVVDGIPLSAGSIADINPNDIASIEILKDASATAIYGSRGANGVILITNKKGVNGKTSVDYDVSFSFEKIHSTTDWMNSGQLLDWQRQAYINGGTYTGAYGTAPDPNFDIQTFGGGETYGQNSIKTAYSWNADGTVKLRAATAAEIAKGYAAQVPVYDPETILNQNWADLVTRIGTTQNHQLSLSAGSDKSHIYLSLGYLNQQSPMIDQDYKRYSLNVKGDVTARKWLTIGSSLNASYSIQNYGVSENTANTGAKDSYGQAIALLPYAPAYDEAGNVLNTNRVGLSANNILLNIQNATNEHSQYSVQSNTTAEVRFTPWLKYLSKFGAQLRASEYGSFYGADYTNPFSAVGTAPLVGYDQQDKKFSWVQENLLFFDKTLGKNVLGVTLLQSSQKNVSNSINIRSQGITFPSSKWYNLGANSYGKPMNYGTSYSASSLMSYMGRVNYSLLNRYLLTASGRWDGASVLSQGNKWDFFPSLAVAWKLEEEKLIKNIQWINQLKLRVGWGVTGNSSVSAYSTTGSIAAAGYVFNETQYSGYKAELMPNSGLKWEKTGQYNLGLDFSVLKNRLSGTVDLYRSNTSDLLMSRSIPVTLGYSSILTNVGKTMNKGIEISLSSLNINTKNFKWRTDISWSTNKEEIVELATGKVDDKANGWYIGQPIAVYRDYVYDRLWQNTPEDARLIELYKKIGNITAIPGQVKIKDQQLVIVPVGTTGSKSVTLASGEVVNYLDNGFGSITDDDKKILGSNRPDWVAGVTNTFSYKNWELSFFVYARIGVKYYGALQTYGRRVETDVWSPTNTTAKFPQPTTATFTNYNYVRNYTDGSLISVRNIALSYNVSKKVLDKLKINKLQVYGQVLNPFMFGGEAVKLGLNTDDVTGWDSTAGAQSGGQTANTIVNRSLVIGLRVGL